MAILIFSKSKRSPCWNVSSSHTSMFLYLWPNVNRTYVSIVASDWPENFLCADVYCNTLPQTSGYLSPIFYFLFILNILYTFGKLMVNEQFFYFFK